MPQVAIRIGIRFTPTHIHTIIMMIQQYSVYYFINCCHYHQYDYLIGRGFNSGISTFENFLSGTSSRTRFIESSQDLTKNVYVKSLGARNLFNYNQSTNTIVNILLLFIWYLVVERNQQLLYIYIKTNSVAYGTRRFNAAFTRSLQ